MPRRFLVLGIMVVAIAAAFAGCARTESGRRDKALIGLGSALFHDATLSVDGSVSCASCHQPTRQFADARATSVGARGAIGTRNAPSLLDLPVVTTLFWDGRESRLDEVVLQPFTNTVEMGLPDHDALVRRVNQGLRYREWANDAFDRDAITVDDIAQSLVAYLKSLPVTPTSYDLYVQSKGGTDLSAEAVSGLSLFRGKAGCSECHSLQGSPALLTDNRFHHTGIGFEKVAGNISGMIERLDRIKRKRLPLGQAILTTASIAELGRFASTRRPGDLGAFRTPSLRNVALTGPYMHDGSEATLESAVEREIYYRGLTRDHPISLTVEEQSQLIAFLRTLNTTTPAPAASTGAITAVAASK